MACCIFVAFLLTQIFAGFEGAAAVFGYRRQDRRGAEQAWRLGDPQPVTAARSPTRPLPRWGTALVVTTETALVGGMMVWLFAAGGAALLASEAHSLSQVRSMSDLLSLCGVA